MYSTQGIVRPAAIDRESITRLVHRFYDDVRADEVLGPTFEAVLGERWATHLPRMVEFWSTVMLGTRSFSGNVFGKHMVVPGVTPLHFRRWLALWLAHTGAAFDATTAAELQQVASGIARNLYRGYFGHAAGFDAIQSELDHGCA
jgi:hemoglobin